MKARLCLAASLLLLAGPALAQEPLEQTGTEPSAQSAPAPNTGAPANEPLEKAGTEPSAQAAPAADAAAPAADAAAPGNEPLEKIGAEPSTQPAPAQQQAAVPAEVVITDLTEAEDSKKLVKPWNVPVDSLVEMDVFDKDGKKIGEVDAVLQDKNGEIKGVAVGYGGFLGFGEKGAIVTLDQLQLKDGTLITEVDEDGLSKLPAWLKK